MPDPDPPDSPAPPTVDDRWEGLWTLGFLTWVFLASLGPIVEFDLWFRLRLGQELWLHGPNLGQSHFLWPRPELPGQPAPGLTQGFSVILYLIYSSCGMTAFPWMLSGLMTALFLILWRSLKLVKVPPCWRVPLLYLIFRVFESRLMLRPQLFTDMGMAVLVYLYLRDQRQPVRWLGAYVAALFWLWMNLHPGAVAGFPVLVFLFGHQPRRALKLLVVAVVASCLRPEGLAELVATFQHVQGGADHPYNLEWQPLESLSGPVGVYAGLTALTWVRGGWRWRRGQAPGYPAYLLVSSALWLLAVRQVRALGEVAAATPVLLARAWVPLPIPRIMPVAVAVLLALGLAQQARRPNLWQTWPDHLYPDGAVAMIQRENPGAGVFCSYHFGGYLTFKGLLPFVHGMTTFYPAQRFQDFLDRLQSPRAGQQLRDDGVGWVLLMYPEPGDAQSALALRLARGEAGWGLVYFDDSCMLFAPDPARAFRAVMPNLPDPIVGPLAEAEREIAWLGQLSGPQSNWVLQLEAVLAERRQQEPRALELWSQLLRQDPQRPAALLARGRLFFKQGQLAASQADLESYVGLRPDSAVGHYNLALVFVQRAATEGARSELSRARAELDRAASLDPHFEPALRLREKLGP